MFEEYHKQIKMIDQKVDLETEFPGWNKAVQFNVKQCGCGPDGSDKTDSFYFKIKNNKLADVGDGEYENADVVIEGEPSAIKGLFDGDVAVIGAFITKELNIKGSVGDAVGVKVLLDAARIF